MEGKQHGGDELRGYVTWLSSDIEILLAAKFAEGRARRTTVTADFTIAPSPAEKSNPRAYVCYGGQR
jgi:hypothetical protein